MQYKFDINDREPLVIVACGSFSPITYLHLRMFEMTRDYVNDLEKYEIIGGYFSPVSDYYNKEGLCSSKYRVAMCNLAVKETSDWLMVDNWESLQKEYQRTLLVLEHFNIELNEKLGGVINNKVMLLAGGDLIESFDVPGLWGKIDLECILGKFGCIVVERTGVDAYGVLLSNDALYTHRVKNKLVQIIEKHYGYKTTYS